jgi:hypothetical protein
MTSGAIQYGVPISVLRFCAKRERKTERTKPKPKPKPNPNPKPKPKPNQNQRQKPKTKQIQMKSFHPTASVHTGLGQDGADAKVHQLHLAVVRQEHIGAFDIPAQSAHGNNTQRKKESNKERNGNTATNPAYLWMKLFSCMYCRPSRAPRATNAIWSSFIFISHT